MAEAAPPIPDNLSIRRVVATTLVVAGVTAGFVLLYVFRHVLFLLLVAIVLAIALKPVIAWVERSRGSHVGAVAGVYAALLVVFVGIAAILIPPLVEQLREILASLPEMYLRFRQSLAGASNSVVRQLATQLPESLPLLAEGEQAAKTATEVVTRAPSLVGYLLQAAFIIFAVVVLSFFWSLQQERTLRWLLLLVPAPRRKAAAELIEAMESKVGAYLRGQGLLCLIVGTMSLGAYWLLGLPYAILLAVIAGILEAVPVFGPIMAAVPPVVVALSYDPIKAAWALLAALIIQQIENYLLVPRVMDRSVGIHPVVTLLALAGFGALLGWMGAVLAVPLAAVIQLVIQRTLLSPAALQPNGPAGRDQASLLQYRAQQLERDIRLRIRHKTVPASGGSDRIEEAIESIARDLGHGLAQAADVSSGNQGPNGKNPPQAGPSSGPPAEEERP